MRHCAASSTESEELPAVVLDKTSHDFEHSLVLPETSASSPTNISRIFSPARVASPSHLASFSLELEISLPSPALQRRGNGGKEDQIAEATGRAQYSRALNRKGIL